jgi:hypothetical protein
MSAEVNRQYADRLGVWTTPTFILFDAAGCERSRWVETAPRSEDLEEVLAAPVGDWLPDASRPGLNSLNPGFEVDHRDDDLPPSYLPVPSHGPAKKEELSYLLWSRREAKPSGPQED